MQKDISEIINCAWDGKWVWEWSAETNHKSAAVGPTEPDILIRGGVMMPTRLHPVALAWGRFSVGLFGDMCKGQYTYTIRYEADGLKNAVDLIRPDGKGRLVRRKGIWQIRGNRLITCTADPGEPRPT
jgi:hypothetical protein